MRKIEYPWINQTYFNGQYFSIGKKKKKFEYVQYSKFTANKRCANMQRCRYINNTKFKNYLFDVLCTHRFCARLKSLCTCYRHAFERAWNFLRPGT